MDYGLGKTGRDGNQGLDVKGSRCVMVLGSLRWMGLGSQRLVWIEGSHCLVVLHSLT